MKLYDVPRNSRVRVLGEIKVPPAAPQIKKGDIIDFHHIDGMYSLCFKDRHICHLVAWAEVEIVHENGSNDLSHRGRNGAKGRRA